MSYTPEEASALLERVQRVVHSLFKRDLAPDIVSTVLVRLIEHDVHEPIPFVTLKHMAIDEIRRIRRHVAASIDDVLEPAAVAETFTAEEPTEVLNMLMRSVRLSPMQGRTLYMWFYSEASGNAVECAKRLGVSLPEMQKTLHEVLELLRSAANVQETKE